MFVEKINFEKFNKLQKEFDLKIEIENEDIFVLCSAETYSDIGFATVKYEDKSNQATITNLYIKPNLFNISAINNILNIVIKYAIHKSISNIAIIPQNSNIQSYYLHDLGFSFFNNVLIKTLSKKESLPQRLTQQIKFILEIDKEKEIERQTYLADSSRKENDAEHAWHMSVMALILSEHANTQIDKFKVISMLLIHDLVEVYAGDSFAYDDAAQQNAKQRELDAADKLFSILPKDQEIYLRTLWNEFEEYKTNEAIFAHSLDNFQPMMLNNASNGRAWQEHRVALSKILKRNKRTAEGSKNLWDFAFNKFVKPNLANSHIINDVETK